MVFIIHQLSITEQIINDEKIGLCKVEIEFARKVDNSLYSLGIFESELWGKSINVNGTHGKRIIKAIKNCLKSFEKTNWKNREGIAIDIDAPKYSLDSIPKKGLYLSFGQMARSNQLLDTPYKMTPLNLSSKYPKYFCDIRPEKLQHFVKYVSDGNSIYVNVGRAFGVSRFIKSKHFGRYIYFEAKRSDPMAVSLFGLTGLALTRKPGAFIIDTETSEVKLFDKYTLYYLTKGKYPEIHKEFKKSKRKLADLERALMLFLPIQQ